MMFDHRLRGWTAPARRGFLAGMLCLLAALGAAAAAAQSVQGTPTDLHLVVRDATTGRPGTPDRVVIDYVYGTPNTILDMKPAAGEFTAPGVPVKDIGAYIVTVWYQGVPYWWQKRGTDLTSGTVTLDVFSNTTARANVAVKGLNFVVQRHETTAQVEMLAEVTNESSPQATVFGADATLELPLPAGATDVKAEYLRGAGPTPVDVTASGTRASLKVPLVPGSTRVHVTALAPWKDPLEIPVGSDLAIGAWSLLTSPASLDVEGAGLQPADEKSVPNYARRAGPAIPAGGSVAVRIAAGVTAGAPEPLFSQPAPGDKPAAARGAAKGSRGGGFPLPLAVAVAVAIIGALVLVRRTRS